MNIKTKTTPKKIKENSTEVMASLIDGVVKINGGDLPKGMKLTAWAGAHKVGYAEVDRKGNRSFAIFQFDDFPDAKFPLQIRFSEADSPKDLCPPLQLSRLEQAFSLLVSDTIDASLCGLYLDRIDFDLSLEKMINVPRSVRLTVDGIAVGEAYSIPCRIESTNKPLTRHFHSLSIGFNSRIHDGALLELIEVVSGRRLYSSVMTWRNMMDGVYRGLRKTADTVIRLEATISKLEKQLARQTKRSNESLILDRIDLFYSLIQDRLDRELRVFGSEATLVPSPSLVTPQQEVTIDAASIEGSGIYELEGDNSKLYRWLGPDVSLIFRDVGSTCKAVQLHLFSVPLELSAEAILTRVNARKVVPIVERNDGDMTVTIPFDSETIASYRMTTLIVEIEFPHSFSPPKDERLLSVAFFDATLCY